MNPEDYLHQINKRLVDDPHVVRYRFLRERTTDDSTFIRARITLVDGSQLYASEFGKVDEQGRLRVITYSYHWMNANKLLQRWDNARHYPNLLGFPHHLHDGDEKNILPGEPMDLFRVLDQIAARLEQ